MIKQRFFHVVGARAGTDAATAEKVIEALSGLARDALAAGNELSIPSIGKIYAAKSEARLGRNPRTGEKVFIEAGWAVRFKSAPQLKASFNEKPV